MLLLHEKLGCLCAVDGEGEEADLREEVLFRGKGLMEEQTQVEAVYINHYCFLLSEVTALVSVELQVPVFVEPLLLVAYGYVVEDIHL